MRLRTLSEFLRDENFASEYVSEVGFRSAYVRVGPASIAGRRTPRAITLANLTAKKPGAGAFTKLVARLRAEYPHEPLIVECVQNKRLRSKLKALGFIYHSITGQPENETSAPSYVLT